MFDRVDKLAERIDKLSRRIDQPDPAPTEAAQPKLPFRKSTLITWILDHSITSLGIFAFLVVAGFAAYWLATDTPDKNLVTKKFEKTELAAAQEIDSNSYLTAEIFGVEEGNIVVELERHDVNKRRLNNRQDFRIYLLDSSGKGNVIAEQDCRFSREDANNTRYQCAIPVTAEMKPGKYRLNFSQFDGIGFNDAVTRTFEIDARDYVSGGSENQ